MKKVRKSPFTEIVNDEKTFKLIQNGKTNNIYGLNVDDCIKYLKKDIFNQHSIESIMREV